MGDINIHIEDENDRATKAFNDWCRNNNFKQIQQENTRKGTILDVVMIRGITTGSQLTTNELKSDHSATIVAVGKSLNAPKHITITKFNMPDEKAARKLYDFEIDQSKDIDIETRDATSHGSARELAREHSKIGASGSARLVVTFT